MNTRLSLLAALAFASLVGLTACGDVEERDDVEVENGEEVDD